MLDLNIIMENLLKNPEEMNMSTKGTMQLANNMMGITLIVIY